VGLDIRMGPRAGGSPAGSGLWHRARERRDRHWRRRRGPGRRGCFSGSVHATGRGREAACGPGLRMSERLRDGRVCRGPLRRPEAQWDAVRVGVSVRLRVLCRRRVLRGGLLRAVRELQPGGAAGDLHARACGCPRRSRRVREADAGELWHDRRVQRHGRLRALPGRYGMPSGGLRRSRAFRAGEHVRRRRRLCPGGGGVLQPLDLRGRGLPRQLHGERHVHPAPDLRERELRRQGQRPGLHERRPVRVGILRGWGLLRERLRRQMHVLCEPGFAWSLRSGESRSDGSARGSRGDRRHEDLRRFGRRVLRHQRPVRRACRVSALRRRDCLPGGEL
jgi:hypothetical protein